jgi:hypothetical protein
VPDKDDMKFSYAELVAADQQLNMGMAIELLSGTIYARRENISLPAYIVKILRAERVRRQAEDSAASDQVLLDEVIDRASAAGVTIVEYLLSGAIFSKPDEHRRTSTWELSPNFLAKLLTRMEERSVIKRTFCPGSLEP